MDDEAWMTELFDEHYENIGKFVSYRAPDLDVDNLTGQVFHLAWKKREDVRDIDKPEKWLLKTARYLISNEIRKKKNWARWYEQIGPRLVTRVTDDHADEVADTDRLSRALAGLSKQDREIVYLIAYYHLNAVEIAEVLGVSPTSVRTRVHRLRKQATAPSGHDDAKPLAELIDRRS